MSSFFSVKRSPSKHTVHTMFGRLAFHIFVPPTKTIIFHAAMVHILMYMEADLHSSLNLFNTKEQKKPSFTMQALLPKTEVYQDHANISIHSKKPPIIYRAFPSSKQGTLQFSASSLLSVKVGVPNPR